MGRGRSCSLTCARTKPLTERFWSKVAVGDPGSCWEWQGSRDACGYGIIGASRHGPARRAHRISWELQDGKPLPASQLVLHACDNPPCVNPAHLYVGSAANNARDRSGRGRGRENRDRGEGSPVAKLTEVRVRAVAAAVRGGQTQQDVAASFGISQAQVSRIVRGVAWRHLWPS